MCFCSVVCSTIILFSVSWFIFNHYYFFLSYVYREDDGTDEEGEAKSDDNDDDDDDPDFGVRLHFVGKQILQKTLPNYLFKNPQTHYYFLSFLFQNFANYFL